MEEPNTIKNDSSDGSQPHLKLHIPPRMATTPNKSSPLSPFSPKSILSADPFEDKTKMWWYLSPVFVGIWVILYFSVVMTQIHYLPTPLLIEDEKSNPDSFIAENAEQYLLQLTSLGPRVVGSDANEVKTIQLLTNIVNDIRLKSRTDLYDIEVDIQRTTGNYMHWEMVNMYRGLQNFVIKFSPKNVTTESYLLINSHFDSKPGSPGAGDDGAMVVVMLEILRKLSISKSPLSYPVVFLLNGAEENPLQASHGFITQHKWAKNCKALINLDAAGNMGREVLFQSGPNHPWLMRHYHSSVVKPFATTLAEEIFQAGLLPSDTDFRIFRDHGSVPGLDFALWDNGFSYHTKYDKFDEVPRGTLQNTGDNMLNLVRSIATGKELEDPEPYSEGHVIFYDVLGWFLVFYTKTVGIALNYTFSVIGLIAIGASVWSMAKKCGQSNLTVYKNFGIIFGIQLLSVLLAIGLNFAMAAFMDAVGSPLVWYGNPWSIFGLYICPTLFGLALLPSLYLEHTRKQILSLNAKSQLFAHANCIVMILFTIVLTAMGFRSSYIFMVGTFFHTICIILNLLTMFQNKQFLWIFWNILSQILPFLYFAYLGTFLLRTLIPMKGRGGSGSNPEILVSLITFVFTWLASGFLTPVLYLFKMTRTIVAAIFVVIIMFIIVCVTPAGFPYMERYAVQRFSVLHSRRVIHNYDMSVKLDEPIFYIDPEDRRALQTLNEIMAMTKKLELHRIGKECENERLCKFPFFNHRWFKNRYTAYYFTAETNPQLPYLPKLTMTNKAISSGKVKYEFELTGPHHMGIFLAPVETAKITSWTFNTTMLDKNWSSPFFMYLSWGVDSTPYQFFVELEVICLTFFYCGNIK
ncbi:hypothetical protein ACFFRR_009467 [Megaselia abdita]